MKQKEILGLDISDHSLEALVLTRPRFGKPKVKAYARTLLSAKVVDNGAIKNPDKLAAAIVKLLKSGQPAPITASACVLSLPESQVFTTVFRLPAGLRPDEIKETLPYKAEDVLPFKSSDVYFDYKILGVVDDVVEIFYAAVPSKLVDSYVAVLEKVKLTPIAFDLETISSVRALFGDTKKMTAAKMIMDIGARTTNIAIVDNGGLHQVSTEKIGGDSFNKSIMSNLKLTAKQAETLKTHHGFSPDIQDGKILYILQTQMNSLVAAGRKMIEDYQSHNRRSVDEMVMIGGSSLLPNIEQYVADKLEVVTNLGNPVGGVADPDNVLNLKNKVVLFTNVIGLALRGIEGDPVGCDINLLPLPESQPGRILGGDSRGWRKVFIRLGILAALLLIAAGVYYFNGGLNIFSGPKPADKGIDGNANTAELFEEQEPLLQGTAVTEQPDESAATTTDNGLATTTASEVATTTEASLPQAPPAELFEVKIRQSSLGYVNVRSGPGLANEKIGEVLPGKIYPVLKEDNGWYQLKLDGGKSGWVISTYVEPLK